MFFLSSPLSVRNQYTPHSCAHPKPVISLYRAVLGCCHKKKKKTLVSAPSASCQIAHKHWNKAGGEKCPHNRFAKLLLLHFLLHSEFFSKSVITSNRNQKHFQVSLHYRGQVNTDFNPLNQEPSEKQNLVPGSESSEIHSILQEKLPKPKEEHNLTDTNILYLAYTLTTRSCRSTELTSLFLFCYFLTNGFQGHHVSNFAYVHKQQWF